MAKEISETRSCPECDHVFHGNGWDGIDAHWRAKHSDIMPYEEAWPLIQSGQYKRYSREPREDSRQTKLHRSLPFASKTTTLVSAAGEYYVLSRLCLMGYIAALAPKGVPETDILVTDISGTRLFAIQVKARLEKGKDKGWHMNVKHETIARDLLFYCFVDFGDGETAVPTTYIVPSAIVAAALVKTHQVWLKRPGIGGRPHKDSKLRRFVPDYSVYLGNDCGVYGGGWLDSYREAWNLLPK